MKSEHAEGEGRPCSDELARAHLEGFIASFVQARRRERARLLLIDRVERRREAVHSLVDWVDRRWQTPLSGQDTFPQVLAARHGNPEGVYHDVTGSVIVRLDVAATWASLEQALFTVTPDLAFGFEELSRTRFERPHRRAHG